MDTGLFACPTCDCLFVAPASASGSARCPICKGASPFPGRAWLEARRAQPFAVPGLAPAAATASGEVDAPLE